MKLAYTLTDCIKILGAQHTEVPPVVISHVLYDSRKIQNADGALFFALSGAVRNGESFIEDAYKKGVRYFVVSEKSNVPDFGDVVYLKVGNPLTSLQKLALYHRSRFNYPVIGITGSVGKTTFKEWAYHLLSQQFRVVRSPKSFNSQLGVALSLLELHEDADIALIEAGISQPGEMERLQKTINPTYGIFTAFGKAHSLNFENREQHLFEKLSLFRHAVMTFVSSAIEVPSEQLRKIGGMQPEFHFRKPDWIPNGYVPMLGLLEKLCLDLDLTEENFREGLETLPRLALRMEMLEGVNGNTIINDTYNLDADALTEALHYQKQLAENRKRVVVLGISQDMIFRQEELEKIVKSFEVNELIVLSENEDIPWNSIENSVVLVKSSRNLQLEKEVVKGRVLKHRTVVEIDLSAIRHNVNYFRERLNSSTKILAMVKASSYGSGAEKVAAFLQHNRVDYFGVAFADEGIALREAGITLPIAVMNPDPEHTELITKYNLEPAVYSFEQLDDFISELIKRGITAYPVHLKFDTGMHRLGFAPEDKEKVLAIVQSQPEIKVKGLYSHLADADNLIDEHQTREQIASFKQIRDYFESHLEYQFLSHLLNSAGSLHYGDAQFDMIRLGIVMYGYTTPDLQPHMQPAVRWKSAVSQVKIVPKGECIGYGCSEKAEEDLQIAIIPVGYADGFRRNLSNGKGAVYINGKKCVTVGRVCMDMIMVNANELFVKAGDAVEIIGEHQTMQQFADNAGTIPYEIMTGLSKRMYRIYTEE